MKEAMYISNKAGKVRLQIWGLLLLCLVLFSCSGVKTACDSQRLECTQQLQAASANQGENNKERHLIAPVSPQTANAAMGEPISQSPSANHQNSRHAHHKFLTDNSTLSLNMHSYNGVKNYTSLQRFHAEQIHRIGFQKIAIIGAILLVMAVAFAVVLPILILLTLAMLVFALFYKKKTQEEHRATMLEIIHKGTRLIKRTLLPLGITFLITIILGVLVFIAALSAFAGTASSLIGLAIFLYVMAAISAGVMLYFLALFMAGLLMLFFAGAFWLVYIESGV